MRTDFEQHGLDRGQDPTEHPAEAARVDAQVVIRWSNIELVEEYLTQLVVVVLTTMDKRVCEGSV